ncbi:MAG TPA: DUF3347 domain-containing protein [Daejeonella sp.]
MKIKRTMMKVKLIVSGLIIACASVSCNQTADSNKKNTADSASVSSTSIADIKDENTQQVYNHYLTLKDVLVSSDFPAAKEAAKELAFALSKVDGCENTAALAGKISNAKDLKEQRVHFTALSSDVIALMKHADVNSGTLFVQYCPMANEGEGAYWLSAEKEVMNPYYGDEMLNCGEVKDTLGAK